MAYLKAKSLRKSHKTMGRKHLDSVHTQLSLDGHAKRLLALAGDRRQ